MLEERSLIYFEPFYFPNGQSAPKEKYFLVLSNDDDTTILASLPTRKDAVPDSMNGDKGCITFKHKDIKKPSVCYRILANEDVLEEFDPPFDQVTHLYGPNMELYKKDYFDLYGEDDYQHLGKMKQEIFDKIVTCFRDSSSVKRGFRRMLGAPI